MQTLHQAPIPQPHPQTALEIATLRQTRRNQIIVASRVSPYRNYVYRQVTGWESFEPTLSRAEQADLEDLWEIAEGLPEEWWNRDPVPEGMPKEWWNQKFPSDLTKLVETLYQRRSSIRQLITNFREHTRNPFPNWTDRPLVSVPAMPADSDECRV